MRFCGIDLHSNNSVVVVTDEADKRVVRQVLNAGSVHQRVQRTDATGSHYFIHRDLYQTLARLRARSLFTSPGDDTKIFTSRTGMATL